ncbi:MAG: hypothetical protein KME50_10785 [Nostoc desertorum CM1-VF14]|nr:hypothetical protein [Nostoc desertorum CM1-VF14]
MFTVTPTIICHLLGTGISIPNPSNAQCLLALSVRVASRREAEGMPNPPLMYDERR